MADKVHSLHHYPDFPLQQRPSLTKSPRSPAPGSLQTSPYDLKDSRVRDRLPSPMRGLNQVRFRQFKKQIDSIRKLSYELPKKETPFKPSPDRSKPPKSESLPYREKLPLTEAIPGSTGQAELHRQVLALLRRLEAAKEPLNALYRAACGEATGTQGEACPVCRCTCKHSEKAVMGGRSETTVVDVNLSNHNFLQECSLCKSSVLHSSPTDNFTCSSCQSAPPAPFPLPSTQFSLLLELNIEEVNAPGRCRTPTPPPGDRRSPTRLLSNGSETDRSPRKRMTISPRPSIHIHKRSEGGSYSGNTKLVGTLNGVPVRLIPGKQVVRLNLNKDWKEIPKMTVSEPQVPATPSFNSTISTPILFRNTEESDLDPRTETSQELLNVSFSQNFLTEPSQPLLLSPKHSVLREAEYVLADHVQIASKHGYVFEVPDMCETYVLQYLSLLKSVHKDLTSGLPEALLVLDLCLKGLILLIETSIPSSSFDPHSLRVKQRPTEFSDFRSILSELTEEKRKNERLEKSLKNVVRNYEEMMAIRGQSEGEDAVFKAETSLLEE